MKKACITPKKAKNPSNRPEKPFFIEKYKPLNVIEIGYIKVVSLYYQI